MHEPRPENDLITSRSDPQMSSRQSKNGNRWRWSDPRRHRIAHKTRLNSTSALSFPSISLLSLSPKPPTTTNTAMSFPTKYTVPEETDTLTDARAAVAKLEAEHRARGLHLSGRIIHVVHYLPIVTTLRTKADDPLISPPKTPEAADIVTQTTRSSGRKCFLNPLLCSRT